MYAGFPPTVTLTPSSEVGSAPLTIPADAHRRLALDRFGPRRRHRPARAGFDRRANDWSVSLAGNETASAKSSEQAAQDALRTLSRKLSPVIAELTGEKRSRACVSRPMACSIWRRLGRWRIDVAPS